MGVNIKIFVCEFNISSVFQFIFFKWVYIAISNIWIEPISVVHWTNKDFGRYIASTPPPMPFKSAIKNLLEFRRKINIIYRKLVVGDNENEFCEMPENGFVKCQKIFQNISRCFWNLIWCSWCPEGPTTEFEPGFTHRITKIRYNLDLLYILLLVEILHFTFLHTDSQKYCTLYICIQFVMSFFTFALHFMSA